MGITWYLDGKRQGALPVMQLHGESFESAVRAAVLSVGVRLGTVHRFRSLGCFSWRSVTDSGSDFVAYLVD